MSLSCYITVDTFIRGILGGVQKQECSPRFLSVCVQTNMATKAPGLRISDLADVLAALAEVTKPYQLGIQLRIESSELKAIEKDYPRDVDRQKAEVIEHWLRNSPDASWTALASAVERMGGQARLAETLRRHKETLAPCVVQKLQKHERIDKQQY